MTRTIVGALKVKLTAGEAAERGSRGKISPEVYDLIVRARQIALQLTPEVGAWRRARMLEHVIALDPSVALAYARLAVITFAEYVNHWNGATADNLTRAHGAGARRRSRSTRARPTATSRWRSASTGCGASTRRSARRERAIELDPNSPDSLHRRSATCCDFQGRHAEAVPLYIARLPARPAMGHGAAFHGPRAAGARPLRRGGDRLQAAAHLRAALRHEPLLPRRASTRRTGRPEEARAMWQEMLEVNPNFSVEHLRRTLPYRDPKVFDRLVDGLKEAGIEI